jgi:hypothetical protein
MNSDLAVYKKNQILNLTNTFNSNVARLNVILANNIRSIQKSRLKLRVKQQQITNLRKQYNISVNNLKNTLNFNIRAINNFIPSPIVINGIKKALLIGINYTGTENELYGCINDANCIKERITNKGFTDITVLTDLTEKKATRNNILNEFTSLLSNSQEGDLLFFLYSGHGSYDIDRNGDEKIGYDQTIVPCDLNVIIDDELKSIIQNNLKKGVTLFAMFDSCFSGSVLDLRYQYMDSLNYDKFTENEKQLETNGDVFMISGSTDKQTSADSVFNNKANGAMTWSLLEALKENQNVNWRELIKKMRNLLKTSNYEQIPQFSSGQFENIDSPIFI